MNITSDNIRNQILFSYNTKDDHIRYLIQWENNQAHIHIFGKKHFKKNDAKRYFINANSLKIFNLMFIK